MRLFLCAAILFLTSYGAVEAQNRSCCRDKQNWYIGVQGSLTFLDDYDIDVQNNSGVFVTGAVPIPVEFDPGYGIGITAGYRLAEYARVEAEASYYRSSDSDKTTAIPAGQRLSGQRLTMLAVNGYLDYKNKTYFTPYIGAGVGFAHLQAPIETTITVGGNSETMELKDWVPAYQFMVGLAYEIPEESIGVASEISLGYRHIRTAEGESEYDILPGYVRSFDHTSNNIDLTWRFYF